MEGIAAARRSLPFGDGEEASFRPSTPERNELRLTLKPKKRRIRHVCVCMNVLAMIVTCVLVAYKGRPQGFDGLCFGVLTRCNVVLDMIFDIQNILLFGHK